MTWNRHDIVACQWCGKQGDASTGQDLMPRGCEPYTYWECVNMRACEARQAASLEEGAM